MMRLTEQISKFMDLYWLSDWAPMRNMVTDDFVWENRPTEDLLHSFDGLIDLSSAFIDARNGWPGIDEGHSVHLRSVENGNIVAQERMDMWRTNGVWFRMPCFGFWTFRENRIASWNDYFDKHRLLDYKAGTLAGDKERWTPPQRWQF